MYTHIFDLQEEDAPGVGGVRRAHDRGLPADMLYHFIVCHIM